MSLSYDRRVADELLVALEPGGFAHSLVEFGGSGMWALDLQLRGLGEETKLYRAALYVGTTKVLDIHLKGHSKLAEVQRHLASSGLATDLYLRQLCRNLTEC